MQATKEKKPTKKKEKKADKEEVPAAAVESVAPTPSSAAAPVDIQPPTTAPSAVDESKDSKDDKRNESKAHEPKRAQRATSNVFALFNQSQIQEFKEVILHHSIDSASRNLEYS